MHCCSTKVKDIAVHKKDEATIKVVDEIVDLWNKMIEADQVHDDTIVNNVEKLQRDADQAVKNLRELLAKLHAIALTAVQAASSGTQELMICQWHGPVCAGVRVRRHHTICHGCL